MPRDHLKTLLLLACGAAIVALGACSDTDADVQGGPAFDGPQGSGAAGDATDPRDRFITPQFAGAGVGSSGQSIGAGLDTVGCGDRAPAEPISGGPASGEEVSILCFYGDEEEPAASIEWVVETASDEELVHIRLTLDPNFADNSYGENQIDWGQDGAKDHKLKDLAGSDHAQMRLTDSEGEVVLEFKVDYISEDDDSPSGYATLGVSGGDGRMITGDAGHVVEVSTSLDRNFNECGFDAFVESSPRSDADFAPSSEAPEWDFRIVYDVWVERSAFGDAGFGQALIEKVHASPSKAGSNTVEVTPGDCPPDWCRNPDGCDGKTECNPLDDGCGGDGEPPDSLLDCEDLPEGCERPD